MKTCFKCNETKPLEKFYRHKYMADGHLNKCKECAKKDVATNYRKEFNKKRTYERERFKRPERKEQIKKYAKNRRVNTPEKVSARSKLNRATAAGKIKQLPCEKCRDPKTQAHHTDYSKPFEVVWLCFICHRKEHGQLQHLEASQA